MLEHRITLRPVVSFYQGGSQNSWRPLLWLLAFLSPSFVPRAMLDYVKMILLKVSFNKVLFEKELRKALTMILPGEVQDFRRWCYQQFSRLYRRVLKRVFGELSLGA